MNESVKTILTLIVAIIGVPTAIFALCKAVIEFKHVKDEIKGKNNPSKKTNSVDSANNRTSDSVIASNVGGDVITTTNINSNNTFTINGSILSQQGIPTNDKVTKQK